ncbi:hypothetical protein SAMN05444362_12247 [Dysgonomonas macrotermitis]|uniref:Uncharacterized protein n=1 Tax=Dysgonomonas macrotermitis TaxID=1346286 RepID=A0A1M5J9D6_9BACT|nr:hypothetical protein SAMN05444362_12247 [Dysgonomonas macrotermitis]
MLLFYNGDILLLLFFIMEIENFSITTPNKINDHRQKNAPQNRLAAFVRLCPFAVFQ